MRRSVRIFRTFGPTLHTKEQICAMIGAGMNGIRLNLSHTSLDGARSWIENLRLAEKKTGKKIELLVDMKGPELRVGNMGSGQHLLCGDIVVLGRDIPVPQIVLSSIQKGDRILFDDGKILAEAKKTTENGVECEIILGGRLLSNKSIAIEGREVVLLPLCEQDVANIQLMKELGVDSVMQPFVRSKEDLQYVREALQQAGADVRLYAKIETKSGLAHLESLFPYCDEIVIARGDLGNAVALEMLPIVQHEIERACKAHEMPYMVVTQMLDSMIERGVPTRAEVNDVFHAVFDGASSIMLTGEVANGKYALEAMKVFAAIARNTLMYINKENEMKTALVIMAAGLGSRYGGGIKQLEGVGPNGEIIMDYSIHDAIEAGFNKIIFIIRKDIKDDFMEVIGNRIEKMCADHHIEVEYAYQALDDVPEGVVLDQERKKPWGTGQAVLACRDLIHEPFVVINADDYYGKEAFVQIHDFLEKVNMDDEEHYCMAGFLLENTLSDFGGVTRGVCKVDRENNLIDVKETKNIVKTATGAAADGKALDADSYVSMNMWGLTPKFVDRLKKGFVEFFENHKEDIDTAEYLLPIFIGEELPKHEFDVKVLQTNDKWFGVTYKEDKPAVVASFQKLIDDGVYSSDLFSDLD